MASSPRNRENGHGMIRETGLPTWEMKPRNRHSGNRFEMGMKYNIQLSIKTTRTSTGTPMETEFIDLDITGADVVNNKN